MPPFPSSHLRGFPSLALDRLVVVVAGIPASLWAARADDDHGCQGGSQTRGRKAIKFEVFKVSKPCIHRKLIKTIGKQGDTIGLHALVVPQSQENYQF